ncbi:MAG: hypothetical protein L0Z50_09820 [Verrucomicrobiales bacterium]|nr:hypothetical protein [Verrucomicrobiales bacterium]
MDTEPPECRDDELLLLIRDKEANPALADSAWLELYRRHAEFVYRCLLRARRLVGTGFDEEDVVVRTFEHVYLKAASSFRAGDYSGPEDARRHVRKWLNQIAQFQLLNLVASREAACLMPRDPHSLVKRIWPDDRPEWDGSEELDRVRDIATRVLDHLDFQIVWFKMQHFDPVTRISSPPSDELATFCEVHGISKELLRQRYVRALAQLKEALRAAQPIDSL